MGLGVNNLEFNCWGHYVIFPGILINHTIFQRSATFHIIVLILLSIAGITRINLEAEAKGIDEECASGQPYHYEPIE